MSEPRRVLVVGAGSIGERHARCFARTGRARVELCERNAALLAEVAERVQPAARYERFEDALAEEFDAVVICTPAPLHVPMARQALEAGAHVLIEKPLSTSMEGVAALETEAQQRGRVVAVAYVYRAHPALAAMREAIAGGRFGWPLQLVATAGQHFPTYRPAYREIYYADRAQGGGAVQDALTHVMNAGEWLMGAADTVAADADHMRLEGVTVEDTAHVLARHGPAMASYALNQHQAVNEVTLTVACEAGTACFEMHRHRWRWATDPAADAWQDEPADVPERDALFTRQAEAFLDAVAGARSPLCSLAEGRQTLALNRAVLSAAEERAWRAVQPHSPNTERSGS
jgi:predicted dehydrogenase